MDAAAANLKYNFIQLVKTRDEDEGEEFQVVNAKTGKVVYPRISSIANKGMYDRLRLVRLRPEDSKDAGAAPEETNTAKKVKRTKIRNFTPKMKFNILTEAMHGNHTKPDGKKIEFQDRNKHGNLGPFYGSVCRVLNDSVSYPAFKDSKAVETTVRQWLDTEMEQRIANLKQTYSENFMENNKFMQDYPWYGSEFQSSDSEENFTLNDDRISDDGYNRRSLELLDSLIHVDKSHEKIEKDSTPAPVHTSDQEEDMTASKVDALSHKVAAVTVTDGAESGGKKRTYKLERPREKKMNPAVQLQEQQSSIYSLLDRLMAFSSDPLPTSSSAPADPAIHSICQALVQHATPPGTVSVCEKLAQNLAGYGFCTFQELLEYPRDRARAILTELKWSPLQIEKVFGPF